MTLQVLIIQRFISNGVSAACIPFFKKLQHFSILGKAELPCFTLSFYFLVLVTFGSAVYFAFFSNPSLFYEEEFAGTAKEEANTKKIQLWVPPGQEASEKQPLLVHS
jgi:hypothetical protein